MKKAIPLILLFILLPFAGRLLAVEPLLSIIKGKRWAELNAVFSDRSYEKLPAVFSEVDSLALEPYSKDQILYKVKFPKYAEMGFIVFKKEKGLYSDLTIENQIKPIYYFKGFRKYLLNKEQVFNFGDAVCVLHRGVVYEAIPQYLTGFIFFSGSWQFKIAPSDPEERLTLQRYQKSETFAKENTSGLFIIKDRKFLESLEFVGETTNVDSPELNPLMAYFYDYFGFRVEDFNEYWFLSVQERENVLVFEKDRKSFYFFDFNEDSSPDSQLRITGEGRLLLNYNAITQPKLMMTQLDEMKKVNLNLFYNPDKEFLSGTATLYFKNKLSFRTLNLFKDLQIHQAITDDYKLVNLFKRGNTYFASSPETDTLSFFFKGPIHSDEELPDLVRIFFDGSMEKRVDDFFFLSRNLDFYPRSGTGFFRSNLKISLPEKYSCLGSGKEVSASTVAGRNQFHFTSDKTKGIALICGDFVKKALVDSKIPIHIYHAPDFNLRRYYSLEDIKECADFVANLYGELDLPAINLLFRRWRDDGGISNSGFVIINLVEPNIGLVDIAYSRTHPRDSPVVFSGDKKEYLVHEFAHQWWGGRVSWNSYRDEWITEGLAQFSTLLYLKETLSESRFQNLMNKALRWVSRYYAAGPIIYGKRIANLDPYEAFQSIVYVKSALVLLMLQDIVGHDELENRLRSLLTIFKYKNISSRDFINCVAQSDPLIHRFMTQWINSRKLPQVTYSIKTMDKRAEITFKQTDSDFVFPIWVETVSARGSAVRMDVVDRAVYTIPISLDSPVRSISVDSRYVPIVLKKESGSD